VFGMEADGIGEDGFAQGVTCRTGGRGFQAGYLD
jgi:hypothetical protein